MFKTVLCSALAFSFWCFTPVTVDAARTAFRLNNDQALLDLYINNPDAFPVCKRSLSYMHFDSPVNKAKCRLFDTDGAFIEVGAYDPVNEGFSGKTLLKLMEILRGYEAAGFAVHGVFLYREEWIKTDHPKAVGGPFDVDRRILSPTDIRNVRDAIAQSELECKENLKIFQLLGGRVKGQRGDSWFFMDDEMKRYLEQFDGIGTECHTVDSGNPKGRETLKAQAALAQWAREKNKECLVFMGGGGASYSDFSRQENTFNYLWNEMGNVGVDRRSPHLIYLRQGAHHLPQAYAAHLPEHEENKLTYQVKWMIENVRDLNAITSTAERDLPLKRTITNRADGKTMEVELIEVQRGKLVCRAKGRRFYIPVSALSDEDIERLKKWMQER